MPDLECSGPCRERYYYGLAKGTGEDTYGHRSSFICRHQEKMNEHGCA